MNKQTKENILQFLNRTELKGYEVPAFNQCISELLAEDEVEKLHEDKEEIQDEDQEDFQDQESDEEELEEHTDKEINKKKKAVTSILDEVGGLWTRTYH